MSSKKAMKQAQKQAYAKHRSNITNSRFLSKKRNFSKNKKKKQLIYSSSFLSAKNKPIRSNAVQPIPKSAFGLVSALHISRTKAPKIRPKI